MNYGEEILDYCESIDEYIPQALQMVEFFKDDVDQFCEYAGLYQYDYDNDEETDIPLTYEDLIEEIKEEYIDAEAVLEYFINYKSNDDMEAFYFASGMDEAQFGYVLDDEEENFDDLPFTEQDRKRGLQRAQQIANDRKVFHDLIPIQTLKKEAEEFVADNFGYYNGYCKRGFILTDGMYASTSDMSGKAGNPPHKVADEVIINHLIKHFKIDKDTVLKSLGISKIYGGGADDSLVADIFNWIRVNGTFERYVLLPKNKITLDQEYALETWIDNYFSQTGYRDEIRVATSVGGISNSVIQQSYYPDDHDSMHTMQDGDSILKKIKKYYQTGRLEESKKKK